MQFVAQRAGHDDRIGNVALGRTFDTQPREEGEKGVTGVGVGSSTPGLGDEVGEPGSDDGLKERLLGGEVTVNRARADACSCGDRVKRYAETGLGEGVAGRPQDLVAVAPSVCSQRAD